MNKIEQAINFYNEERLSEAEKLALEVFDSDNNSVDAIDVLAAIYLKVNSLNFLNNLNKSHMTLVRKIARFLTDLKTYEQAIFFYEKAIELEPGKQQYVDLLNELQKKLNS